MEIQNFAKRLTQLRMNKNVSARDMSLSLGQGAGYVNNIENGVNFPSMAMFFYICEYLGVTPAEFFDDDSEDPVLLSELISSAKKLSREQISHLLAISEDMRR